METKNFFEISEKIKTASDAALKKAAAKLDEIEEITEYNQQKVLSAFINNRVSEADFAGSTGYGYGDSGKTIKGEFTNNGVPNTLSHTRGAISMARSQKYDSASCQFFIVHEDARASLDGDYACFGYVTEGMDIVDKICTEATPMDRNGLIMVEQRPHIQTITVTPIQ